MNDAICKTNFSDSTLYTIMSLFEHEKDAFVCYLRGELCESESSFFREISAAMRFPYYFGWNIYAFDECITDLEWLKFSCILLVINNFDQIFKEEDPSEGWPEYLIRHLEAAVEDWETQNIPMLVILNYPEIDKNSRRYDYRMRIRDAQIGQEFFKNICKKRGI
ncbi:MAG: barstar family protein [Lachnospiraceae bacterium]|nr:barstar family protein [Lachnospiraceae bacterium]